MKDKDDALDLGRFAIEHRLLPQRQLAVRRRDLFIGIEAERQISRTPTQ
jgi:hypothetical protein